MHQLMKYKVTAVADKSLSKAIGRFGKTTKTSTGRLSFAVVFDTEQEAIHYLIRRAESYYTHQAELREAIDDIIVYGCLTIDGVTACVEKLK